MGRLSCNTQMLEEQAGEEAEKETTLRPDGHLHLPQMLQLLFAARQRDLYRQEH